MRHGSVVASLGPQVIEESVPSGKMKVKMAIASYFGREEGKYELEYARGRERDADDEKRLNRDWWRIRTYNLLDEIS